MQSINRLGSGALKGNGSAAVWALLVVGLGALAWPAEALAWTGQPLAYVTNFASNSVSVIDTGDDTVVDTVLVGNGPERLAVAPDGKHVYVAISTDNDLAVIDTTSDKVVKTVAVAGGANRVAVTPDGKRVYVAGDSGAGRAFVTVIDTTSDKVVNTVAVAGGANDVAVTPDGKRVYVTGSYAISVIDATSDMVVATIPNVYDVGSDGIAIAPDGKHAYTTNSGAAHAGCFVSVIDAVTATNMFGTRLVISGPCTAQVAITPNGNYIYAPLASLSDISIFAIKTATNAIEVTFPLGQIQGTFFTDVAITPDGRRAYVSAGSSVVVVDTRTNSIIATIAVPGGTGIAIIPPPQGIQFLAFKARLDINFGHKPRGDGFDLEFRVHSEQHSQKRNSSGVPSRSNFRSARSSRRFRQDRSGSTGRIGAGFTFSKASLMA